MIMASEENKPFLHKEDGLEQEHDAPMDQNQKWPFKSIVLLHLSLVLLYTAISTFVIQANKCPSKPQSSIFP